MSKLILFPAAQVRLRGYAAGARRDPYTVRAGALAAAGWPVAAIVAALHPEIADDPASAAYLATHADLAALLAAEQARRAGPAQ